MSLTWSIAQPPERDLLARLGRRWVLVYQGCEVHTRKKYSRFWSQEKAEAKLENRRRTERHFGRDESAWSVIDLMAPEQEKES